MGPMLWPERTTVRRRLLQLLAPPYSLVLHIRLLHVHFGPGSCGTNLLVVAAAGVKAVELLG